MRAVVGMVAGAIGIEVPAAIIFGPKVDLDLMAFASGGQLGGSILSFIERKVGKQWLLGQLLAHHEDVIIKAMKPGLSGEKGLERVRQARGFET